MFLDGNRLGRMLGYYWNRNAQKVALVEGKHDTMVREKVQMGRDWLDRNLQTSSRWGTGREAEIRRNFICCQLSCSIVGSAGVVDHRKMCERRRPWESKTENWACSNCSNVNKTQKSDNNLRYVSTFHRHQFIPGHCPERGWDWQPTLTFGKKTSSTRPRSSRTERRRREGKITQPPSGLRTSPYSDRFRRHTFLKGLGHSCWT